MATTKQVLLTALAATPGQPVSGQVLAQRLGLSRAAINKAARSLADAGWPITGQAGLGYALAPGADLLTAEAVLAACPLLSTIEIHPTLGSTNSRAKALALAGHSSPALVLTEEQTGGVGRLGRSFASPAGKGLYMSLVLQGSADLPSADRLTCATAVAVCRAVRQLCGLELSIKWVNDLFYKGKKVCGILTEAGFDLESGRLGWVAVGIGLNLTTTGADFGPLLAATAGSLYPGGPCPFTRAALAGAICQELLALAPHFDCLAEYRAQSLVLGHWLTVSEPGLAPYPAKALAIDEEGRLLVELAAGGQKALRCGEVSTRPAPRPLKTHP